ncbi:MAG: hypothetical protein A3B66_05355 [Alphaproteobacteria bacterium RIFCSPHIGHO2_02_FULL_46_13]|nr:MAG: hypothetical protein A3B66_05355 [Alphaproteobacteria bacterium RIFCSPHIGHO2_02_FULL_46_13]
MGMLDRNLTVEQAVSVENTKRLATKQAPISDAQVAVLKKMGFTNGEQVSYFNAEIESNPKLKEMFSGFEKDFASTKKYDAVLKKIGMQVLADGAKINFDPDDAKKSGTGIIDKLSKDLSGKNGPQMIKQLRERPDTIGAKIDDYAAGKVEIAALLAEPVIAASSGAAAPASAAPTPTPSTKKAAVRTSTAATPAAVVAPATPEAATPPAQAANAPATAAPAQDPTDQVLTALAGASDKDIKSGLTKSDVKLILKGMADQASSKFGVNSATSDGFKKRVETDPALLAQITTNFQNNPEFVRQLAKAAKNKEPMDKAMVDMARPTMTSVMENPEKLADDKYVKDLSQKMNMGSSMGGFGKILNNIFGEGFGSKISGWFNAIFSQIKSWISGFTGDKQVISMKSGGNGSFLPTVMVNLDAINANRDAAAAQARYSPLTMTALSQKGADGKFFHDEQVKDKDGKPAVSQDGKPVMKTVMNGAYTITDIDGKQHSVMPSVGQLEAKQDKDGNVYGRFVTKINANGVSDELATIRVSEAEFKKYEEVTNKRAREAGLNQTLAFSTYTAQDAANAAKAQTIQMVSVDPKTSAVSPVTAVNIATPQEPSVGYTVVNGTVMRKPEPAKNDPEFALRGNG